MSGHALIIGCGYLGKRVASRFMTAGWKVSALTRSQSNAENFLSQGISPCVGDVLEPATLATLPSADVLIYAVGYDRQSKASMQDVYVQGLANVIQAIGSRVQRVIYISSTSVYSQNDEEVITAESATTPKRENGKICLAAEQHLQAHQSQHDPANSYQASILRLAGIYGPDRTLSRIEQFHHRIPMQSEPEGWLNLIHVDDAADVIWRVTNHNHSQPVYLVSDNEPVKRRDYYTTLAQLADAPPPTFEPHVAHEFSIAPARGEGLGKRCDNQATRADLNWAPLYPTYREGLAQIMSCDHMKR
jgi:nucleoside-diphosphate-sugar epimerase